MVTPKQASVNGKAPVDQRVRDLVQLDQGLIGRQIFTDPEIYERELEQIFARCWLYLGHATQVPNPGDFFTTYMGEDHVIVVRDREGRLRAFLNSCRHRGMRVCRADAGTTKTFLCPYHGWSYSIDGALTGVPKYEVAYQGALNKADWGLIEVAQLDTFDGLIFATWDPQAPSLRDYLGGMSDYLDLMVNRLDGGVEVIGGVQKWRIPVNWKIPAENFIGDDYHLPLTHGSAIDVKVRASLSDRGHSIAVRGHGFGSEMGGPQQGSAARTAYTDFVADLRQRIASERGDFANSLIPLGHGTIFPNLSFLDTVRYRTLRLWHPRGPAEIEVYSWCLVDKALPPELKESTRKQYLMTFGPSGMFEQEDGEIWSEISLGLRGYIARRETFNYEMGLGQERRVAEVYGNDLPGEISSLWSEQNQRSFYRHWQQVMLAP